MLRVTVEIVPHGDESAARDIAKFNVINVTELSEKSDYAIVGRTERLGQFTTKVKGHMRKRGWIPLLKRILDLIAEAEAE